MKAGRGWCLGHRERLTLEKREDTSFFESEENKIRNYENIRCFAKEQQEAEGMVAGQLGPFWKVMAGNSLLRDRPLSGEKLTVE